METETRETARKRMRVSWFAWTPIQFIKVVIFLLRENKRVT
jgi:hypothetical protein